MCPELANAGMITAIVVADFDNDKKTDLIIAGEWMPLLFFKNVDGHFKNVTLQTGLFNIDGMWRSLEATDIDKDGDIDFVAGNLGLNCRYHITPDKPMWQYAKDLDGNGSIDPVIGYYIKDNTSDSKLYPAVSLNQFTEQVPSAKKKYLYYKDFAKVTMDDIFKLEEGEDSFLRMQCNEVHSCWFENIGNGKFTKHILPAEAQFTPVNSIVCTDIDNDGKVDLLLGGNEYQAEVMTGRYDASYGCYLKGDGKGNFLVVKPVVSGFVLKGDIRDMKIITILKNKRILLAAVNNDLMKAFGFNK